MSQDKPVKTVTLTESELWKMIGKRFCKNLGMNDIEAQKHARTLEQHMKETPNEPNL